MNHRPLTTSFVSVIDNFCCKGATDRETQRLRALIYERKVVALKRQSINRPELIEFAKRFGGLEPFKLKNYHDPEYPSILVLNNLNQGQSVGARKLGNMWHSDSSYLPVPLPLTFLHAQRVPTDLGDTLFIDMESALAGLPSDIQGFIRGRKGEHDVRWTYKIKESDLGESIGEIFARIGRSLPPVLHPTVLKHPITGKQSLYMSPGYTVRISGYTSEESDEILGRIFSNVTRPEVAFAYRWEPQDLLIWDNRSVIHCATPVPEEADRLLYRIGVTDGKFFGNDL